MKVLILSLGVVFACGRLTAQTNVWQPSPGHAQLPIWPQAIPDADAQPVQGREYVTNVLSPGGVSWMAACNVSRPTMTVYSPKGKRTGVAVVVFPGGGYNCLAIDLEGTEICDWLTLGLKTPGFPWRCIYLRKAGTRLDYDHRSFRLPSGLKWWRSGSEQSG